MSPEIQFPIEFVVSGTAVSAQNKGRRSLRDWRDRVKEASRVALLEGHFATASAIAVTLYYFTSGPMQGDIDNIVKPVLDALNGHIYLSDHQVHRVLVQKFEPDGIFLFSSPSRALEFALTARKPNLYVRLIDDPFEDLA